MHNNGSKITNSKIALQMFLVLLGLYLTSFYSYLLFHSLSEVLSAAVAFCVFAIAWNARQYIDNNYVIFVGTAYFFIAFTGILHGLTYKGMGVFPNDPNMATQLWLVSRTLLVSSFLFAPYFIDKKIKAYRVFSAYLVFLAIILLSIFYWKIFPTAYAAESGLTLFKKASEYIISFLFLVSFFFLFKIRDKFDKKVFKLISAVVALNILVEIIFTLYISVYDNFNLLGHLLMAVSVYLTYVVLVEIGLKKPYSLLFRNLKDREMALRESEERYKSLFELSPDAIIVHIGGLVSYINQAGIRILGADSKKDIVGQKYLRFIPDEYKDFIKIRIGQLYAGLKQTPRSEIKLLRLDNSLVDVEITGILINFQNKKAIQVVISDITERKKAENEMKEYSRKLEDMNLDLEKFRLGVDNASDSIVITDSSFKVIYANNTSGKIIGYEPSDLLGKTLNFWGNDLSVPVKKDGKSYNKAYELLEKETSFSGEVINKRKNGEAYIAELHISPIHNKENKIIFYLAIERDITKLKEIDRAKTEFVSLASHQLRTPLASISLSSELLLRGAAGPLDAGQQKYIEEIHSSTQGMAELISVLLNISRIELGTFTIKPEPIEISANVDSLLNELNIQISKKGMVLERKLAIDLPIIRFDKNILRMVVENLITNSVRYTTAGGLIAVDLNKDKNSIILKVRDTGCGIPPEEKDKIFSKLYRAENAKEISAEGAGLGLYIVKSILEKIGSKIWYESEEGLGTTFFVKIPLK